MKKEKVELLQKPPIAKKIPYIKEHFGVKLTDNYHWIRDYSWPKVDKPEVLDYLHQENAYTDYIMKNTEELQKKLFEELKGRIKEEDQSYPIKKDNYYYYSKIGKGQNHSILCRRKGSMESSEEILLDENELAEGHVAFNISAIDISPDHKLLAYSTDTDGSERFTIVVKDLEGKKLLNDSIKDTIGHVVWHENKKGFYYLKLDENWRANRVFYHELGTDPASDKLIYKEEDITFNVGLGKSSDRKLLFIASSSNTSDEIRFLDFSSDSEDLILISKREEDHLYDADHRDGLLYIRTNDKGRNFRLVTMSIEKLNKENWQEIIPHSKVDYLIGFDISKKYLAVIKKIKGLNNITIKRFSDGTEKHISFKDDAYAASGHFPTYESEMLRLGYSSLNTPASVLEYDFEEGKLYTRKTQEIPTGYNKNLYQVERLYASTKDGVEVPISLVYKKDKKKNDGSNPLYLYGYGSYGISMSAGFNSDIISLLDRGFVFAIAHIRGGDELGFEWYESAKFLNKKRTFEDFIISAEYLINNKYTSSDRLVIAGGSAGGMLMGAVVNMRPDLFKAVVAMVPFVDVVNTMLDESLPLTPGEYKEWGNPQQEEYFHYMRTYSPYDNVVAQDYPAMLVQSGLTDPRVTYWEPTKWVAKLRDMKTDNNILILKTDMEAGHKGQSGRYDALKEKAFIYAFVLKALEIK